MHLPRTAPVANHRVADASPPSRRPAARGHGGHGVGAPFSAAHQHRGPVWSLIPRGSNRLPIAALATGNRAPRPGHRRRCGRYRPPWPWRHPSHVERNPGRRNTRSRAPQTPFRDLLLVPPNQGRCTPASRFTVSSHNLTASTTSARPTVEYRTRCDHSRTMIHRLGRAPPARTGTTFDPTPPPREDDDTRPHQ